MLQLELLLLQARRRRMSLAAPDRPLLAPWYRLVEDGDRLLLEHGRSVVVFEGGAVRTLLPVLLPLLDGLRTFDELVALLGEPVRPAIGRALELLAANGLVLEGGGGSPAPRAGAEAVAAEYGLNPDVVAGRLREAVVGVVGGSPAGAEVARLLHRSGVGRVRHLHWEESAEVDLAVVAPARDEPARVPDWNLSALERGTCWLGLRPFDGVAAGVGPLVVPGESCCHACLLLRLASHVDYGSDFARIEGTPVAACAGAPLETMTACLAAHLALAWIGGLDTQLPGVLHWLETRPRLSLTTHAVLRVPRCPACSAAERVAPRLPWHEAEAA
jgi:bacteriocin biosynthesis cyclodehydratase domain-containing protein